MAICTPLNAAAQEYIGPTDMSDAVWNLGINIRTSTVVVRRLNDGHLWVSNPARARQAFIPASTADIPHTLIALEAGIAAPDEVVPWRGETGFVDAWHIDQTLREAFKGSVIRVYQDIAKSVGHAEMSRWMEKLAYGNRAVGRVPDLTSYWSRGPLKISAMEQVDFLSRLVSSDLPLSQKAQEHARHVMLEDSGPDWKFFAKTGWGPRGTHPDIGWCVGWVEQAHPRQQTHVFAVNLDMIHPTDRRKRQETARHVLRSIGALPRSNWH
ncbi:class D beta-lactamase [Roseobacter sp. MH60115]|uniref:class D beta-lactamase n=1 Tax=Roseobacter sp. MH60115 TaxID=2785324 RepID=UPI0018A30A56|nr:class D beta-lactamase [Roseobacter sp. MH60115]